MPHQPKFPPSERYYQHIAALLSFAFAVLVAGIVVANTRVWTLWLENLFGPIRALLLELYLWAALGATVASYKFFAEDKERNEIESLKEHPNPQELRYPNVLDVILYGQRVLFSGVLGVIAALLFLTAFHYFDVPTDRVSAKVRLFLVVVCFVVGMYQNEFLVFLSQVNRGVLEKLKIDFPKKKT